MSQLSYMEKLLDGVEVEWKLLGEVYKFQYGMGNTIPTTGGEYPVYGSNGIVGTHNEFNSEDSPVIGHIGAYAGIVNWGKGKHFVTYNGVICKLIGKFVNSRYAYHFLLKQDFYSIAKSASHPFISYAELNKVLIPIPCPDNPEKSLAIQAEIVRILDAFTAMTAELTAELNMRKKQYNYYRDQLLSFEEGDVEWKALGKIAEINTGQKPSEILDTEAEFDYINAGTTRSGYCALSNCEGDTVTTPSRGQGGIGFVGYQNKSFWLGPLCYKIRSIDNKALINKYLFYILQSKNQLLLGLKKEGGVPAVNKSDLAKLEVPVPSITEQERIVEILDKFDMLTTSIKEGLPREIELRRKQYEYYRDLLLSFPKSHSDEAA
ncbi:restriction endonuclease subunit S [Shewanella glacialipiscicola]|uniref:restriction endonuclease subunit S n=1 Tax=Shewanella glacialipiscicola TaxID=614069 RepID=UPI003D79404C